MPDWYKRILLPLFDVIKSDIVARSIKIMDKVDYLFYVNGSLWALDIVKTYIKDGIKWFDKEKVSLLTRQPIGKTTKPWQWKARSVKQSIS